MTDPTPMDPNDLISGLEVAAAPAFEAERRLGAVVTTSGAALPPDLVGLATQRVADLLWNDQHRGDLFHLVNASGVHYDPQHDRFRHWDGTAWVEDESRVHLRTEERIRQTSDLVHGLVAPAFVENPGDDPQTKERRRAGRRALAAWRSRAGRANVLAEAKVLTAVPFDQYDREPEALNTPEGLVGLRGGTVRPHHPSMLVTRVTRARHDPEVTSAAWDDLLESAMPDREVREFVQDCYGASLTGITSMRCVFVLYGPRGTRKSTVTRLFREALGSYADVMPETAVAASTGDRAINEGLAKVIGRRAVFCDELSDGFRLNIALLKRLTGSDLVTIEQKFKPSIAYRTSAKVWFTTNHPFEVPAGEDAAWARFYVIPFEANPIPEERADKLYAERLAADPGALAAVLRWGIEGARRVLARGGALAAPAAVDAKRAEVRRAANPLDELLEEGWLALDPGSTTATRDLRDVLARWRSHCPRRFEVPSDRKLGDLLRALGAEPVEEMHDRRGERARGWRGIRVDWNQAAPPSPI